MSDIVVTGLGIISALGMGADDTYAHLLEGRSGIGKMKYLQSKHTHLPVGEVPFSDEELRDILKVRPEASITRTSLLGAVALREALVSAELLPRDRSWKMAFVSGATVGGMEKSEQYYYDFLHTRLRDEFIALHDCGACTDLISQANPYSFELMTTISTACSSAANAIILGANMLKLNRADIVVVGGTECLSKFHLDGFNTLMILDHQPCRPFDKNRSGLNLGEGAAYLVMEREEVARSRGILPLCKLSGYSNRCDAFHQTASSPDGEGAYLAMKGALEMAGLQPSDIDYINAHGTGTPNNDESEGHAMMRLFGDAIPPVSSTKSYTGHTTSASGGVEAVISILSLIREFIPANLNFSEKIDSLNFTPVTEVKQGVVLNHILTNSFGFGGNDSSCIFSKIS